MKHEPVLTVREVAEYLDVHVSTVRKWIDSGKIDHERIGPDGCCIRIPEREVSRLRQRHPAA